MWWAKRNDAPCGGPDPFLTNGMVSFIKALAALLLLCPGLAEASEHTYTLDEGQSYLFVELRPASGLLSKVSHRHVVRASGWTGTVRWDPANPVGCSVEIEIPVSQLVVDEPKMRQRLGYEERISDGDRDRVRENMLAEDQLFGKKHQKIRFSATKCERKAEGIVVTGDLEIRGVKKQISVPMKVDFNGDRFRAQGKFTLKHSDFGFEPYSTALGAISNDEALRFQVRVIGRR